MRTVDCPVEGCGGFETTSDRPNTVKHIKSRASTELLMNYMLNETEPTPHADYLKSITVTHNKVVTVIQYGEKQVVLRR